MKLKNLLYLPWILYPLISWGFQPFYNVTVEDSLNISIKNKVGINNDVKSSQNILGNIEKDKTAKNTSTNNTANAHFYAGVSAGVSTSH